MTHRATDHPVRLLCDQRGIYGIGCESEAIFAAGSKEEVALSIKADLPSAVENKAGVVEFAIEGFRRCPPNNNCFKANG